MLDGVSLDQIRTFIAAADEGSFSAAGRHLRRAQSVVSQTLANLEGQLGVKLFDRSGHLPVLTDQGRALLADARAVACDIDLLKARAKSLAGGLEPELSVAVDVMFPDAAFASRGRIPKEYPATLLRFDIASSAVVGPARRAPAASRRGIMGAGATPTHAGTSPDGQGAHGRIAAAPSCHSARPDSDTGPRRAHSAITYRSFRSVAGLRSGPLEVPESLAPFPFRRQTCLSSRGLRLWRHAAACYRGGSGKRRAR